MYLPYSPFWLQWFYPSLLWHKSRKEKSIFLTFDDGPVPVVTPFVLNTLKTFNAKATFFCIGENIKKHPDIFKRITDEGHAVGNHTYNHLKGWETADKIYLDNVSQCAKLTKSNLFRPPYGRIKKSQICHLKSRYSIIMWDVLSGDFDDKITSEKCLQNVKKFSKNGSIIVFHDSLKAFPRMKDALPKSLDFLISEGYNFLPL
ncbi:MAG: polysaccharide deacetylase family protein [Flavobacterium sp.]|nr:polysaccharide deacetylase family protein [Pedobacter sp.]